MMIRARALAALSVVAVVGAGCPTSSSTVSTSTPAAASQMNRVTLHVEGMT